jgi:hypothetical protein
MKNTALPPSQVTRLARVRQALEVERRPPGEFHGKRLQRARHIISVPLGRRWRALFVETALGYIFRDCLTHERYNKVNLAAYKI